MWEDAVNRECLIDIAKIILNFEDCEMGDSEFRRQIIDRIYELDEPRHIINS